MNGTGSTRAFGTGYGVGDDEPASNTELALLFGYTPVATIVELPVQRVEELVVKVATEIRTRGETVACLFGARRRGAVGAVADCLERQSGD